MDVKSIEVINQVGKSGGHWIMPPNPQGVSIVIHTGDQGVEIITSVGSGESHKIIAVTRLGGRYGGGLDRG